ncbi:MAG: bifunctional methylenetetrahydrofolate dehydrogenase/methenyltetrahydrofolate cyclohydrolase, partial [Gammaproteobacteria bacterium]|nr:bifunctional methylenetetrahydrofolate dehydrogenase/methenyltetrahydrofolate cyclohydrolase [Gammaproteobacteria bacterium]
MASAIRIDGKAKAAELSEKIKEETAALAGNHGIKPGLAVVIIGEDPASQVYVRNKKRTADACGFHSIQHSLPADVSQRDVLDLVASLNEDK